MLFLGYSCTVMKEINWPTEERYQHLSEDEMWVMKIEDQTFVLSSKFDLFGMHQNFGQSSYPSEFRFW